MLHGPPGTGKTSAIKAIASQLNRHIVNIQLRGTSTTEGLMNTMYSQTFIIVNGREHVQTSLKVNEVVFVFEDIDAAGSPVLRRTSDKNISDDADIVDASNRMKAAMDRSFPAKTDLDLLTLNDILNIFDGVADSTGRVVIMTTNHLEKLDPAMFRPGRVDMCIELGYIQATEAKQMIEYFIPPPLVVISDAMFETLKSTLEQKNDPPTTPAALEQIIYSCLHMLDDDDDKNESDNIIFDAIISGIIANKS